MDSRLSEATAAVSRALIAGARAHCAYRSDDSHGDVGPADARRFALSQEERDPLGQPAHLTESWQANDTRWADQAPP